MLFLCCWTICNKCVIQMWVIMFFWKSILNNFVVFSYLQISFLTYLLLQTNELPSSFCFLKPVQFWLLTNTGSSNLNYWTVLSSSSFAYWIPYFVTVHLFFNLGCKLDPCNSEISIYIFGSIKHWLRLIGSKMFIP